MPKIAQRKDAATSESNPPHSRPDGPHWDNKLRCLTFRGRLVKHFRQPAPSQELILAAFEEQGWPVSIDDPLPGRPGQHPKQRLHDAIENLNRRQRQRLLRFRGNGFGTGIFWEPCSKP